MCTFGNFWNAVTIIWKSCLVRYLTERPKKGLVLGHVGWWSLVFATLVILRLSWAASSYAHVIIMPLVLPTVVFAPRMEKQTSEVVTFTINMHFTHHLTIFWRCHISFTHSVIATVQTWRNRNPFFLWPSDNCQWLAIASVTCQSYAHINAQPKHPAATFLCSSRLCMWHQNGQNKLRRMARSWPQGSGCMSALCASGPVTARAHASLMSPVRLQEEVWLESLVLGGMTKMPFQWASLSLQDAQFFFFQHSSKNEFTPCRLIGCQK